MTPSAGTPARPIAVLVEREGLGDVLLKLPLLRAIARGFPNTPIWWISTHQTDMAGPLRQFMPPELAVVREHARLGKPLREAAQRLREFRVFRSSSTREAGSRMFGWRATFSLTRSFSAACPAIS